MHPRTLEEIWKFAKSQDAIKSGPHLADLLEIFTSFTDEKSSVEILNKMREAPAKVCSYRQTAEVGGGCSTKKRKEAILAAVRAFKWGDAVGGAVLGLISKTAEGDLEHAAALALTLKVWMFGFMCNKFLISNSLFQFRSKMIPT